MMTASFAPPAVFFMHSAPDYLILDVDGVLIGGVAHSRWDANIETDLGIRPKLLQEKFFEKHWQAIMRGHEPIEPALTEFLETHYPEVSIKMFLEYWHGNDAAVAHHVLDAARNWKHRTGNQLALATNQEQTRARFISEDLGFSNLFETLIVSCNIGHAKPEPEYYAQGDLLLGRTPDQKALFLDDMLEHVEAAIDHGWQAIHVESVDHAAAIIQSL